MGRHLEPCKHPQRGGFPAAGRSDEDQEFAIRDIEVQFGDNGVLAEYLPNLLENDLSHVFRPPIFNCGTTQ
jgi:hypothetical protein